MPGVVKGKNLTRTTINDIYLKKNIKNIWHQQENLFRIAWSLEIDEDYKIISIIKLFCCYLRCQAYFYLDKVIAELKSFH